MINGKKIILLIAFILISGIGLLVWSSHRESSDDNQAIRAQEISRLRTEIESIKKDQQATKTAAFLAANASANIVRQQQAGNQASPSENSMAETENNPQMAQPTPHEPTVEEIRDQLDTRFNNETRDPGWDGNATDKATRQIAAHLPAHSRLLSADCRHTMCRLEVAHESIESHQSFIKEAIMSPENNWEGPYMATLGDNSGGDGVVTVIYLAREGTNLAPDNVSLK